MTGPRAPITVPMISRMQELKDLRISVEAIARIITHDWKVDPPISGGSVRHYTKEKEAAGAFDRGRGVVGLASSGPVENLRRTEPPPESEPVVERPEWDKARYADNEKVAEWLDAEGHPQAAAQLRNRKHSRITFWALDNKLTALGLLVEHLPDPVWIVPEVPDVIGDYKAKRKARRAA